MPRILLILITVVLLFSSIWLKKNRYYGQEYAVENRALNIFFSFMKSKNYHKKFEKALTDNTMFIEYTFAHGSCAEPIHITPLFGSSQGSSLSQFKNLHPPTYIYKDYIGDSFPTFVFWRDQLLQNTNFPAVLSIQAEKNCQHITTTKWVRLWNSNNNITQ